MRKNPGRQIRTYSQRLDEYFGGPRSAKRALKPQSAEKTYFNVHLAPLSLVGKIQQLTIEMPSWMFEEALADGMITHRVYFVSDQHYKFYAKRVTALKPKQKTKRGVNGK